MRRLCALLAIVVLASLGTVLPAMADDIAWITNLQEEWSSDPTIIYPPGFVPPDWEVHSC